MLRQFDNLPAMSARVSRAVPGIKLNPHAFPLVTPMEPPVYPNVPPTFEMQGQYLLMVRPGPPMVRIDRVILT
jgi:hypothetical protein